MWQWDSNQRILVEDPTITEVHFCNKTTPNSLVVETYTDDTYDGKVYAEIPNILLQEDWDICVYAFCNCYTKVEERIKVKARSKPSDYVYTETEVKSWSELEKRIDDIEKNGISDEVIGDAVADYLTEHPIEAGATQEEVAQINKNKEDIATLNTEIDNLPTKEYVDNEVKNVKVDLTGYATEQYVKDEIDKIEVNADLEGYATENWVLQKGYISSVPSEYVTESELTAMGYATNSQLSAYAMKSDIPTVPTKVSQLENDKKYLTDSALGGYAKKTDIPQKVSYFENDKGYLTEHIDISGKADKEHTHSQYMTKTEHSVWELDFVTSIEQEYYNKQETEQYVVDAVKNVGVDLTGYATEQYVDTIIADINECDTYFFNPFEVEWASGLNPTPAPDSLAEFAQRILNGDGVSLYVAHEVSEGDRRWTPCEVCISDNEVRFHRCLLHYDFGREVAIQTYRVYESTNEGYDWCVQGSASMLLSYDLKYATESYVNNAIANIDTPEGSGSQEVFYFNLSGYTSWKAVTDDMATVLDRLANGEHLCIYAKESNAYAVADVFVSSATNITFLLHYTDYVGGTTTTIGEYLAMKLNGVWEMRRQSATIVTFATKQYVDDAVANSGGTGGGLTADEVQQMIDDSLGVIENGSY